MSSDSSTTANAGEDWPFSGGFRLSAENRTDTLTERNDWATEGIL